MEDLLNKVEKARDLAAEDPDAYIPLRDLALALLDLGNAYVAAKNADRAITAYEESLGLFERLSAEYLAEPSVRAGHIMLLRKLQRVYEDKNDSESEFAILEKLIAAAEDGAAARNYAPDNVRALFGHIDAAIGKYTSYGKTGRALELYNEKLEIYRRLLAAFPDGGYDLKLYEELHKAAGIFREGGDTARAVGLYEERIAVCESIAERYPEYYPAVEALAETFYALGELTGDKRYFEQALDCAKRLPNAPGCRRIIEKLTKG